MDENNCYPFGIIDEEQGWLLLEKKTINNRTLIAWYNPNNKTISLFLFNTVDQPNDFSKRVEKSLWGFPTYFVTNMMSTSEAAQVVSLYLQDIEQENYWWEKI